MKAVQVVGFKKSGKTTLVSALVRELSARGLRVAAAKCMHHSALDKEGTDTARLLESCGAVAALTPDESAVFWGRKRFLSDLVPLLEAEVLVVEGGKTMGYMPRIILPREAGEADDLDDPSQRLALAAYGDVPVPGLRLLRSVAEAADLVLEKGFMLPNVNCGACGFASCREMAARITAGEAELKDCAALNASIVIKVNGAPLALNPFVENMLGAGIRAMLSTLKGYAPGRLEITMDA